MKKIENEISLLMGMTIGFVLTMVGLISSGTFSWPAFISSYLVSFLISQILTRIIPVRKISETLTKKMDLKQGSVMYRLVDTFISDLCYSPIMTFIMVSVAYYQATSHGAKLNYGAMLLKSEVLSFIIAFIVIYFVSPLIIRTVLKRNGIAMSDPAQKKQ